ncbi:hypothetical protein [Paraglaciecola aestuariivivens]
MTSKSKQALVEHQVNRQLDQANAALPEQVKLDIATARLQAQAMAKAKQQPRLKPRISIMPASFATLGVAILVAALVSYQPNPKIPALPAAILTEEVPLEDLALLEDLEFANWLAEQQEVLL